MNRGISSFYVTGGTLAEDAPSYVEREADQDLYQWLVHGEFCYVLTARQTGKSSLMVRTATRLRDSGAAVVLLDLTQLGQNLTVEQWYFGLLNQVGQQLDLRAELREFWVAHPMLGPLQRCMTALREVVLPRRAGKVVIFIDEIDVCRSLRFSTDEFFAAVRECFNRRAQDAELNRLTFCLLGVATPSDLIRNSRMTPFNIGRRVELEDFNEADAAPLAVGLVLGQGEGPQRSQKLARSLLQRILHWTGGHPYLTQRLCEAVALDPAVTRPADVDGVCRRLFLTASAREQDDNLLFVRERLLKNQEDQVGLLSLYSKVRAGKKVREEPAQPLMSQLRLAGIVRVENGLLRVRNRIYNSVFDERWVRAQMPDAEARRQRVAYQRGLLRASALSALLLGVMGSLSLVALNQTRRVREREQTSYRSLYVARINLAWQSLANHDFRRLEQLLDIVRPSHGQEDLRGWEWRYLWQLSHREIRRSQVSDKPVTFVEFLPGGRRVLFKRGERSLAVWDWPSGRETGRLDVPALHSCRALSPDGRTVALGVPGAGERSELLLLDLAGGTLLQKVTIPLATVESVAFSPAGGMLAAGGSAGGNGEDRARTVLIDLGRSRVVRVFASHGQRVSCVAFSPDGQTLAAGSANFEEQTEDAQVALWNTAGGKMTAVLRGHKNAVFCLAFSPDGRTLASGDGGGIGVQSRLLLWNVRDARLQAAVGEYDSSVHALAFSPDRRQIAAAEGDTVHQHDLRSGEEKRVTGHWGSVRAVAFSPDSGSIATGGFDGTVRIWRADELADPVMVSLGGRGLSSLSLSHDAGHAAVLSDGGPASVWDLKRAAVAAVLPAGEAQKPCFWPDSRTVAFARQGDLCLWDIAAAREERLGSTGSRITAMAPSAGGGSMATAGSDGAVELWSAATRSRTFIGRLPAPVRQMALSANGRLLAAGGPNRTLSVWTSGTRARWTEPVWCPGEVRDVACSPDGTRVAVSCHDGTVLLTQPHSGRRLVLGRQMGETVYLSFSPDGRTLAGSCEDGRVRLWSVAAGQDVGTLRLPTNAASPVTFSADGTTLAAGAVGGTLYLWRAGKMQTSSE